VAMRERMAYSARPEVPPTMTVTRGWVVRTVVFREVMVGGGGGGGGTMVLWVGWCAVELGRAGFELT